MKHFPPALLVLLPTLAMVATSALARPYTDDQVMQMPGMVQLVRHTGFGRDEV